MASKLRITPALALLLAASLPATVVRADEPAPTPPAAAPSAPAASKITFTINDAGAEPRAERRYAPTVGDVSHFELVVNTTQQVQTAQGAMPEMSMPAITFVSGSTIASADGGVIASDITFESISVSEHQMGPMLAQMLKPMEGKGGTMKLSDRGDDLGFALNADTQALGPGAAMADTIVNSLRGVLAHLPTEAIGAGAVWTTVEERDEQGVMITQTIKHTLESIDGDAYVITLALTQSAGEQDINSPNMVPGASMRLKSLSGEGAATVNGSLTSIVPTTVTLNLKTSMDVTIKQGETENAMTQTISTSAVGRSVEAPAAPATDAPATP